MKILAAAALGLVMSAAAAQAAPNLVTNGSFETGDLSGWTSSGGGTYPVSVITTDGSTGSAFGEAVPSDPITLGSPDAGGNYAVYFVDDVAHQTLTQTVHLLAGSYEIGFDAYAPQNGFNNTNDAMFSGTIADVTLANFSVHGQDDPTDWVHFSGIADVLTEGDYIVTFDFSPEGNPASDVVVDRAYVIASDQIGGTPIGQVPEPITLSLFGAGLAGVGAMRRRRKA
jgi:hypothetical protein